MHLCWEEISAFIAVFGMAGPAGVALRAWWSSKRKRSS